MNKVKWVNIFAFALVIIMCVVIVNSVSFFPTASAGSTDAESEEIYDPMDEEIEYTDEVQATALYKAGDSLKAWQTGRALYLSAPGFKSNITGTMNFKAIGILNVTQTLNTYRMRYGNGNFYANGRSSGSRTVATETFYDVNSNMVYVYEDSKKTVYSLSQYTNDMGLAPNGFNFIINESTYGEEISFKHKVSGDYEFVFTLKTNGEATVNYSKFINYGGRDIVGSQMPKFSSIRLTLTVDKDGYFKKLSEESHYTFDVYGGVDCVNKFTENYTSYKYIQPVTPSWL